MIIYDVNFMLWSTKNLHFLYGTRVKKKLDTTDDLALVYII